VMEADVGMVVVVSSAACAAGASHTNAAATAKPAITTEYGT